MSLIVAPVENDDDEIMGISITLSSDHALSDVHLVPDDCAQNYENASLCFIGNERGEDGKWVPFTIFVANHLLAMGEDEVLELLKAEANRRWTWHLKNGEPLGRLPTTFEGRLRSATDILCAVSRRRHY